jgi:hypothetical protein
MRLSLEESSLIPDYIQTITASEKIIWQGKMQLNHLRIAPKLEIPIELIFILIALITFLCTGGHYLFLYKLALIIITISSLIYYNKSQKKENRQNKIKFNEYLITTSQIVFIHWHDQNIHLNTLPLSNVKKYSLAPSTDCKNHCTSSLVIP